MLRFILAAGCLVLAFGGPASAQSGHSFVDPAATAWAAGPASLPPGAKGALLYGDPAKAGLFVLRLWFPKGYKIPPHSHPRPEIVTVISGSGKIGFGRVADEAAAHGLTAGSFLQMNPGTAHYVSVDEDTVVQLSTMGPWAVDYVNPADDPRRKGK